jgi:hypothetical protein
MEMDCGEWVFEIVERAREGSTPGLGLREHLNACPGCSVRWEDQSRLREALQAAKAVASQPRPAARRDEILREFERMHPRVSHRWPRWALAAAAMLVLTFGLGRVLWNGAHPGTPPTPNIASFDDADENNGFVAVPYAPPLAANEMVSVVRTELEPTALARLGILVDASYGNEIPAEVEVGEDGLPRAVRVIETAEF